MDSVTRRKISIVTACYNEEENVAELHRQVKEVMEKLPYDWDHIFIDNCSEDRTVEVLRGMAAAEPRVKVLVNSRNFGHVRSGYHAMLLADADAVISVVADLQDPPSLIPELVRLWEGGNEVVMCVKRTSEESPLFFLVRRTYYAILNRLSEVPLVKNATGFGLYDRKVMDALRRYDDPYPYFRGLVVDVGFKRVLVPYDQPVRKRGLTKNNFYTLYDLAMTGITNHSRLPLRAATMLGFGMGGVSLFLAVAYFVAKLLFWDHFPMGTAPILIAIFFFSSVQLFFTGIIGEYVGSLLTQVQKRPLTLFKERINWDAPAGRVPQKEPLA